MTCQPRGSPILVTCLTGLSGNSHAPLPFDAWPGVEPEGTIHRRKDPPSEICLAAVHGQEPPRVSDPERPGLRLDRWNPVAVGKGEVFVLGRVFGGASRPRRSRF